MLDDLTTLFPTAPKPPTLEAPKPNVTLMRLEMKRVIRDLPGRRYVRLV